MQENTMHYHGVSESSLFGFHLLPLTVQERQDYNMYLVSIWIPSGDAGPNLGRPSGIACFLLLFPAPTFGAFLWYRLFSTTCGLVSIP